MLTLNSVIVPWYLFKLRESQLRCKERYRYQWIVIPIFESKNSIGSFEIYVPGIRIRISLISVLGIRREKDIITWIQVITWVPVCDRLSLGGSKSEKSAW
jgi:hypothetical protein